MIGMATINKPALVLADEPTTALDPETGIKIMQTLLQACKMNNSSLLVVSHDIRLIAGFCRNITVMRKGETLVSGSTAFELPRFSAKLPHGCDQFIGIRGIHH